MKILKPLTYSAMHFLVAITVTFAITRSITAALGVGLVEPMVQTFAYILHEKMWARFSRKIVVTT